MGLSECLGPQQLDTALGVAQSEGLSICPVMGLDCLLQLENQGTYLLEIQE